MEARLSPGGRNSPLPFSHSPPNHLGSLSVPAEGVPLPRGLLARIHTQVAYAGRCPSYRGPAVRRAALRKRAIGTSCLAPEALREKREGPFQFREVSADVAVDPTRRGLIVEVRRLVPVAEHL